MRFQSCGTYGYSDKNTHKDKHSAVDPDRHAFAVVYLYQDKNNVSDKDKHANNAFGNADDTGTECECDSLHDTFDNTYNNRNMDSLCVSNNY